MAEAVALFGLKGLQQVVAAVVAVRQVELAVVATAAALVVVVVVVVAKAEKFAALRSAAVVEVEKWELGAFYQRHPRSALRVATEAAVAVAVGRRTAVAGCVAAAFVIAAEVGAVAAGAAVFGLVGSGAEDGLAAGLAPWLAAGAAQLSLWWRAASAG